MSDTDDPIWSEPGATLSPPLSATGAARRLAVKHLLVRRVVRRRRTRQALRAVLLLVVASGIAWVWPRSPATPDPTGTTPTMVHADLSFVATDRAPSTVQQVFDDDSLLARVRVEATPLTVVRIDDTELLDLLRATDRTEGFVRIGTHVLLAGDLQD